MPLIQSQNQDVLFLLIDLFNKIHVEPGLFFFYGGYADGLHGSFNFVIPEVSFPNSFYDLISWALRLNWAKVSATELHWQVNIGAGNGSVPSGNKPLPELMLTQIYVNICLH